MRHAPDGSCLALGTIKKSHPQIVIAKFHHSVNLLQLYYYLSFLAIKQELFGRFKGIDDFEHWSRRKLNYYQNQYSINLNGQIAG